MLRATLRGGSAVTRPATFESRRYCVGRRADGRCQISTTKMRFLDHAKEATVRNEASEQVAIRTYPDNMTLLTGWFLPHHQGHSSAETRLVHHAELENQPAALRMNPSQSTSPHPEV